MKRKREPSVLGGTRRVIKLGDSLAVTLPRKFWEANGIREGDDLPYAANHIIKFIPMAEEKPIIFPSPETPKKKPGRTGCPYCHAIILKSALESHIKNYCPRAPAEVKAG